MDISKLLDFLSLQHKGFAISLAISLPLFYVTFYVYDARFIQLDLFDRAVFTIAAGVLFQFLCYVAAFCGNIDTYHKNLMPYATMAACVGTVFALTIRAIVPVPFWMLIFLYVGPVAGIYLIEHSTSNHAEQKTSDGAQKSQ